MPDFVTVLTEDHRRVEQLFNQYDESGDPAVAQQILETLPDTAAILGDDIVARKAVVEEQIRADRSVGMAPSTTSQKPTASPEPGW